MTQLSSGHARLCCCRGSGAEARRGVVSFVAMAVLVLASSALTAACGGAGGVEGVLDGLAGHYDCVTQSQDGSRSDLTAAMRYGETMLTDHSLEGGKPNQVEVDLDSKEVTVRGSDDQLGMGLRYVAQFGLSEIESTGEKTVSLQVGNSGYVDKLSYTYHLDGDHVTLRLLDSSGDAQDPYPWTEVRAAKTSKGVVVAAYNADQTNVDVWACRPR